MAVEARRGAMSGPTGVGNAGMGIKDLGGVWVALGNELAQTDDLADLLEGEDLVLAIAVDSQAGGVVATVLESGETIQQGVDDMATIPLDEVIDIAKNATGERERDCQGRMFLGVCGRELTTWYRDVQRSTSS